MKEEIAKTAQEILKGIEICEEKLDKLRTVENHDNKCIGFFYGGGSTLNLHAGGNSDKVIPELEAIRIAYIATVRSVVEKRADRLRKEFENL